jgi:FHS family L-fucose permease-like MFS transporter
MSTKYRNSFYLLTSLFFMWGLITVLVDSLIPRLREVFELTYFQAGLVQFAFFIAYGLVSIPAGSLLHRIGYKQGIIIGLCIMGLGCLLFLPAASMRLYGLFLLAYFILASGMTVLQVAANPYVTVLGPPETASSRLNLSQAFNSLGTTIAPALGAIFILSDNIYSADEIASLDAAQQTSYLAGEASAVQLPFLILASMLFVLAAIVLFNHLPKFLNTASHSSYGEVLKDRKLLLGALGIFVYVGAEVAIGSYLVSYFIDMNLADAIRNSNTMAWITSQIQPGELAEVDDNGIVASFVMFYWGGAMIGRFVGFYLPRIYQPSRVLGLFAILAIVSILLSMLSTGFLSLWSILAVGLFNSIMFPTIFSIAIEDLDDLKPQGSGILCTAIAGGAFIPPLYGFFTDVAGFKTAFILLLFCYFYIWFYGKTASSTT